MRIKLVAGVALGGMLSLLGNAASAGLITVPFASGPPAENACSGVFGTFPDCEVNGSQIIVKYNVGGATEINSTDFPTFDGSEISFGAGSWSYTMGAGDPTVLYWAAKGGSLGFNLFYVVPDASDAACAGSFDAVCLDQAIAQTSGTYAVPSGSLSNLSFYNGGGGGPPTEVPAPATLVLLGLGLVGLGLARRTRT